MYSLIRFMRETAMLVLLPEENIDKKSEKGFIQEIQTALSLKNLKSSTFCLIKPV